MFYRELNLEQLTENKARELCDAVFDSVAKETLEITLGNETKIPLYKQFYYKFQDRLLKHNQDKTIFLMANIYQHSKQDILKLKLLQLKINELNEPENFSLTRVNNTTDYSSSGNMNTETMSGSRGDKGLMVTNTDVLTSAVSKSIDRGASSSLNEDYKEIDKSWDKRDLSLGVSQSVSLPEIKLADEASVINLDSIKVGNITKGGTTEETVKPKEEETDEFDEIIYTDISLGKAIAKSNGSTVNAGKSLNNSKTSVEINKNILTTNMGGRQSRSLSLEFSKNDTTYQALSLYASNFRESFFNSFNSLFINLWSGY